jgi:hypothetical protein
MAEVAQGAIQWQRAASNSPDLVAPYLCDLTAASSYRFTPRGYVAGVAATQGAVGAEGMIVDNMMNGTALQVQCGPIIEVCPAFQKTFIRLDPGTSLDVVVAGSSGTARVYFFTGAFHGNTQNVNTYAAYKAGVVSTNTDGTQDVYFNTLRWKTDSLLANGFNLDNLQDSGFFDVLNPVSPASGNLGAGTYLIESHVYSSVPLYGYQQARNILSPDTQVYERRQLGGAGWTPWRNIGLSVTGQCQFQYVDPTHCRLMPLGGGLLTINGNVEAVPYNAGSGLVLTNAIGASPLTPTTIYFVYAFMIAGAMQLELSLTPYALDARGLPIKSGDATRTCVGMFATNAEGKFQDTDAYRGVATFFNRITRRVAAYFSNVQTASLSPANAGIINALSWGDDAVRAEVAGSFNNNTTNGFCNTQVSINGSASASQATQNYSGGATLGLAMASTQIPALGIINIVPQVWVNTGVGTWNFVCMGLVRQ